MTESQGATVNPFPGVQGCVMFITIGPGQSGYHRAVMLPLRGKRAQDLDLQVWFDGAAVWELKNGF